MRLADTNVLLYSISRDPAEREKQAAADEVLRDRGLCLSAQVLQEFYLQATRTTREDRLTHQQAARLVHSFTRFRIATITTTIVEAAITTSDRFQISYWDAAIIEAARSIGCSTVLSEDLSDGQDFVGVTVLNPF